MPFSIVNKEGRQILMLEGAVTIQHAQELASKLGEDAEDGMAVGVDTGGLTDIDTCILQLLYSMRKTLPELCFDNPSEVFIGAVDRCGLRRELLSTREGL
jgi:anti-anti-sigma regulatory factor